MNREIIANIISRIRINIYETIGEMNDENYASAAFNLGTINKDLELIRDQLDEPEREVKSK